MLAHVPDTHVVHSTPLDSAASITYINDASWFSRMWHKVTRIRTADGNVTKSDKQGTVNLDMYDQHGKHARVTLHNAVYAPKLQNLVSASDIVDTGNTTVLSPDRDACRMYLPRVANVM